LERARGKLALARQPLPPEGFYEDLSFSTQQAAELSIKAVYQVHGWLFPFVHNLGTLLDGLESQGLSIPQEVQGADQLSVYAVQARYPGIPNPTSRAEFEESLRIAETILAWAQSFVP
jgi:HEPN domain-containing protein